MIGNRLQGVFLMNFILLSWKQLGKSDSEALEILSYNEREFRDNIFEDGHNY